MADFVHCYRLLIFIVLTTNGVAQIAITSADVTKWYAAGKAIKGIGRNDTSKFVMDIGTPSANQPQSWTFPGSNLNDTLLANNLPPSSTPHFSIFPSATHATITTRKSTSFTLTIHTYVRIFEDSLCYLGTTIRESSNTKDTTTIDLSNHKVPLPISINMNSRWANDSINYGQGEYSLTRSLETIDAFGTIAMPEGIFECLRQKIIKITEMHFNSFVLIDTVVNYSWLTKEGHKAQVEIVRESDTLNSIQVRNINRSVVIDAPTVVALKQKIQPKSLTLLSNYPNPFNPSTNIGFYLPRGSQTQLTVYNTLGIEISKLVNKDLEPGYHSVLFEAGGLPSGIYYCRLLAGEIVQTGRMNFIK